METKNIVITGGTSGIGAQMVKILSKHNQLIILARTAIDNQANVTYFPCDLSDADQVQYAIKQVQKNMPKIDVLINNAAIQHDCILTDKSFSIKNSRQEIEVNFNSVVMLCHGLLENLRKSDKAVILNINSGLGLVPKTRSAIYNASKGALNIFSQSLRHQLREFHIDVKQAFLPLIDTNMTTGRGSNKLTASDAAQKIIHGLVSNKNDLYIGKVTLLHWLNRISPTLASNIMKNL